MSLSMKKSISVGDTIDPLGLVKLEARTARVLWRYPRRRVSNTEDSMSVNKVSFSRGMDV